VLLKKARSLSLDIDGKKYLEYDERLFSGQPWSFSPAHRQETDDQAQTLAVTSRAYHTTTLAFL